MPYSAGFKARMVQRMLGREGLSASALSREVGITQPTLSRWLRDARSLGAMSTNKRKDETPPRPPHKWTAEEKLEAVREAEGLNEAALGAFLRERGLHTTHLEQWRKAALEALQGPKKKPSPSPETKKVRELEKELRRKDKALAEVTALLALKKKLHQLLGDEDDGTPKKREK